MIFKDRVEAGKKLGEMIKKKEFRKAVVVSLLRGGVVVGHEVAKILKTSHYPLPVAKISSPIQPELAIGALCFDEIFLDQNVIKSYDFNKADIVKQVSLARQKFSSYLKRFSIKKSLFRNLRNKTAILVDDGIATGATMRAGALFLKTESPKKIVVAAPVGPVDFDESGFDQVIIYHLDPVLSAISRFYRGFPQVEDDEIKRLLY
jgi:putative phosphoribosyl transferase